MKDREAKADGFRRSRDLSLVIVLAILGGTMSVPIGYAGRILSQIPLASPVLGQFLSGLHVFWLVLVAMLVKTKGAASTAGALKGLVEALLFSHIGIFAFAMSLVQGLVIDVVFTVFKKRTVAIYVASGFSSASNVVILQFLLLPQIPMIVYLGMYSSSFLSGALFGGYLASQVLKVAWSYLRGPAIHTHARPQ